MRKTVELLIDEEEMTGIEAVSLVRFPAIEENFVYLSATQDKKMLFASDDEKQMLIGPALIPDKLIMRLNDANEEYDVYFSKETVRQAMELFMKEARTNEHTLEHATKIEGVTVVESWIIESEKQDKSALYGFNLPVGTWMLSVKVNNEEIWNQVKNKEVRGFSIEGYFTDRIVEMQQSKLCKHCPKDADLITELKKILIEELKPATFLDGQPLFNKVQEAELWGETFHNVKGFEKIVLNGKTLYASKRVFTSMVIDDDFAIINDRLAYASKDLALKIADDIKCGGFHTHDYEGKTWFMPCEAHALTWQNFEDYPWDECIADQMREYGSKETAEKICGAIKAKYG